MELSAKQKMLGAALYMHHVKKETAVYILMLLDAEDDLDDMCWYMSQHPQATDNELIAVASQLDKERKQGRK
jgi:hypothetical protein